MNFKDNVPFEPVFFNPKDESQVFLQLEDNIWCLHHLSINAAEGEPARMSAPGLCSTSRNSAIQALRGLAKDYGWTEMEKFEKRE